MPPPTYSTKNLNLKKIVKKSETGKRAQIKKKKAKIWKKREKILNFSSLGLEPVIYESAAGDSITILQTVGDLNLKGFTSDYFIMKKFEKKIWPPPSRFEPATVPTTTPPVDSKIPDSSPRRSRNLKLSPLISNFSYFRPKFEPFSSNFRLFFKF